MTEKAILFNDFNKHLLNDIKPSEYFNKEISTKDYFSEYPFYLLKVLTDTPQSPLYHPEGSVWNHTMMVLDNAALLKNKSRDSRAFMWAALLHDIGKAPTTKIKNGKITSYDHDVSGADLAFRFLSELTAEGDFVEKVTRLVRWHMQPLYVSKGLPFAHIEEMNSQVSIDETALFSLCDRLGRGGLTEDKVKAEKDVIKRFTESCKSLIGKI
ncbi:MAG: HDIG domain-containing protein [Bacillota bacterium]|nr:HDIG domain-containing protein [Bacillota bacterium]